MSYTLTRVVQIDALCLLGVGLVLLLLHRWRPSRTVEQGIGLVALLLWLGMQFWYMTRIDLDIATNLPIYLCDLAALVGALMLIARWRLLRGLFLFMAGFAVFVFIWPVGDDNPGVPAFWFYWLSHTAIVGLQLYDVLLAGYRPDGRALRFAALVLSVYFFTMLGLNLLMGWNYAYLGRAGPPMSMGGWPWHIVIGFAVGHLVIFLLWLPWHLAARRIAEKK